MRLFVVQEKYIHPFLTAANQSSSPISRHDPRRHTSNPTRNLSDLDAIAGVASSPDLILGKHIENLSRLSNPEVLMRFLPLILNKHFSLLVRSSKGTVAGKRCEVSTLSAVCYAQWCVPRLSLVLLISTCLWPTWRCHSCLEILVVSQADLQCELLLVHVECIFCVSMFTAI